VILGPSLAAGCNAMTPLVQQNGPVLYCLTAGVKPDPGSYVFSTMTASQDMLAVAVQRAISAWPRSLRRSKRRSPMRSSRG